LRGRLLSIFQRILAGKYRARLQRAGEERKRMEFEVARARIG